MTSNRINTLLRGALFSGLGVFSCLLLVNYTNLPQETTGKLHSVNIFLFFIVMFNLLGWLTIRLSGWFNNQYALHIRRKWRVVIAYTVVVCSTLGVNYALFVAAKLLVGAAHPFTFPNGGIRILILVWLAELVILTLMSANKSMQDALKLQQRAADLQKENNAARYAALQNQLNPHFLFNSLNTLVAEIEYDPQRAVSFTRNLSNVYRYVLQCQNKPLVTLRDELAFATAYLFLHEVRLGDCIRCRTQITDEEGDCMLPPLTLQLLIENVIKHNSITQSKPMEIRIGIEQERLVVANGLNPKKYVDSTGVGLKNLSNRCLMMLGRKIEVTTTSDLFVVKIPLLYE